MPLPRPVDSPLLPFHDWALRPPMGWNSWDCFATTVTEEQVRAHADYMAAQLSRHGWRYVVVDIQWYEPNAAGFHYREGAQLELDAWGRLLPAPERFPSSRNGKGFRPLADYVHARGLAFGLHLLRGIPRQAVARDLPVLGSSARAAQIARTSSVCAWNPDMFGVDMSRPGAAEYYDSVFALFAEWGVDYVKVDDISRPYHDNEAEIEAIRGAIDRSGRPMVLSLSPGATALSAAAHVQRHANLWRISDDFWDNWDLVREQFGRLAAWNPHRGPGHWPDADMLPFGVLDLGRRNSRLSRDEHYTVMTLWAIARSPLMHGGDMTRMDDFTLSLLSNAEVIAVNQASVDNRPLFDRDGLIAWLAQPEGSNDRYLALFNARDRRPLDAARARHTTLFSAADAHERAPFDVPLQPGARLALVADDGEGGSGAHRAVLWADPVLSGPAGERPLVELDWLHATSRWGSVRRERGDGARAFGVHTKSVIEFEVPEGYTRLRGACGLEGPSQSQAVDRTRCMIFVEPGETDTPSPGLPLSVSAAELGLAGPLQVRDLWRGADLGSFETEFTATLPWHGAGLYRVAGRPV